MSYVSTKQKYKSTAFRVPRIATIIINDYGPKYTRKEVKKKKILQHDNGSH